MTPEKLNTLVQELAFEEHAICSNLGIQETAEEDTLFLVRQWRLGLKPIPREVAYKLLSFHTLFVEEVEGWMDRLKQKEGQEIQFHWYWSASEFQRHNPSVYHRFKGDRFLHHNFLTYLCKKLAPLGIKAKITLYQEPEKKAPQQPLPPGKPNPALFKVSVTIYSPRFLSLSCLA